MQGITELTKMDFDYAKTLGGTIKLLGVAERNGDKVSAYVSPYRNKPKTVFRSGPQCRPVIIRRSACYKVGYHSTAYFVQF